MIVGLLLRGLLLLRREAGKDAEAGASVLVTRADTLRGFLRRELERPPRLEDVPVLVPCRFVVAAHVELAPRIHDVGRPAEEHGGADVARVVERHPGIPRGQVEPLELPRIQPCLCVIDDRVSLYCLGHVASFTNTRTGFFAARSRRALWSSRRGA